ncbi:MAG: CDP-diacylglycerol--serine O-phosphatidyltransferase [Psychromonas sp.]|nr:CDP-diacylglycerol--serine O-phosphatidyltransferase [Psychromonas sp.]
MISRIKQSLSFLDNLQKIPLSADSVDCLFSAKSFKKELLEQIAKAQYRIYLAALYLEADAAGEEILMALYQAKQNNPDLDIVVCIDFHRAQRGLIGAKKATATNASWYQDVEKAQALGVKIMGVPVKRKELFGVQHLKGFVFDDRVFYSGASFNNIYLHHNEKYRYDRYWLINSQPLADCMVNFLKQEIINNGAVVPLNGQSIPKISSLKTEHKKLVRNLKQASYQYPGKILTDSLSVAPLCGLGARRNQLNKCIRKVLQSTKNELIIFTPYFNLPRILARDINGLIKRGVKLTLVAGDKTANDFYIPEDQPFRSIGGLPYLYESNLKRFAEKYCAALQAGQLKLHLWKNNGNSFHLKGIYADNRFVMLTGHNLNPRAWRLDIENGLLIDDPEQTIKGLLDKELAEILKNTSQITDPKQIEGVEEYPEQVKKLLLRMRRIRADKLVKGLI